MMTQSRLALALGALSLLLVPATATQAGSGGGSGASKAPTTAGKTVVGLAIATPTLSTLVAAVKAAGLAGTLSGTGPFTVFAPTNAAFAALGAAVPTLLKPANKKLLTKVLEYHVVTGTVLTSALMAGTAESQSYNLSTLEGQRINITIMNSIININTASINGTQAKATNGVVHIINKVLLFPGFALPGTTTAPTSAAPTSGFGCNYNTGPASKAGCPAAPKACTWAGASNGTWYQGQNCTVPLTPRFKPLITAANPRCCPITCYAYITTVADILAGTETQCPGYKGAGKTATPTTPNGTTVKPTSAAPTLKPTSAAPTKKQTFFPTRSVTSCKLAVNGLIYDTLDGPCTVNNPQNLSTSCPAQCQNSINKMLLFCSNATSQKFDPSSGTIRSFPFDIPEQVQSIQTMGAPLSCNYLGAEANCPSGCGLSNYAALLKAGGCATTFVGIEVTAWNSCSSTCLTALTHMNGVCRGCQNLFLQAMMAESAAKLVGRRCLGRFGPQNAVQKTINGTQISINPPAKSPANSMCTCYNEPNGSFSSSVEIKQACAFREYTSKAMNESGQTPVVNITESSFLSYGKDTVSQACNAGSSAKVSQDGNGTYTFGVRYGGCGGIATMPSLQGRINSLNDSDPTQHTAKKNLMALNWKILCNPKGSLSIKYFSDSKCKKPVQPKAIDGWLDIAYKSFDMKSWQLAYPNMPAFIAKGLLSNMSVTSTIPTTITKSNACTNTGTIVTSNGTAKSNQNHHMGVVWHFQCPAPTLKPSAAKHKARDHYTDHYKSSCGCNESYTNLKANLKKICCPNGVGDDCDDNGFSYQCGLPISATTNGDLGAGCVFGQVAAGQNRCSACQAAVFESALNVCPTLFLGDPNYAGLYKNCGGDFNKLLVAARKPPRAGNAPIFPSAPAGAKQKPGTVSVSKVFLIIGGILIAILFLAVIGLLLTKKSVKVAGESTRFDATASIYDGSAPAAEDTFY